MCLMLRRPGIWYLWGRLVQSQLLHHSQVLHNLHPHLLLFHPRDDHALLLHLHYQHGQKHKCHVSRGFPHSPAEEGGERCHKGRFRWDTLNMTKTLLKRRYVTTVMSPHYGLWPGVCSPSSFFGTRHISTKGWSRGWGLSLMSNNLFWLQ